MLTKAFRDEFSEDSVLFKIHYANGTVDEYLMNITDGIIAGAPVSRDAAFDITDNNLKSAVSEGENGNNDDSEEFEGNKVLASLDVSELNANAFATEALFTLNSGEEPSICLRLNDTDDQYYYLGSQEYDGWFQSYPHLGGVLVTKSGTYEGEKVTYENISTLAVETWGRVKPQSMKIYLYSDDELVGIAEYSAENSQLVIIQ